MKVVHLTSVHDWRDPRIMGKMLASIQRAGHEAVLVALGSTPSEYQGVRVVSAGSRGGRLSNARRVVSKALDSDADIYHLHDPELLIPARALSKTGAKVLYDIHEDYRSKGPILGRIIRLVEQWSFGWLDAVVTAESSYMEFVPSGVLCEEILNYHLGSPAESLQPRSHPEVPIHLAYTGVISQVRGLDTLLQVAELSKESGRQFKLTLCGICHSRDERRSAEQYMRENSLSDIVTLIGWDEYATSDQIAQVQRSADIGLCLLEAHPNYLETVPTKFYEYMSHGLPFVCSAFPRWQEFVTRNDCGAACDQQDARVILDEIQSILDTPGLYERYSAGAATSAAQYRWEAMETRLLRFYEQLASSG